MFKIIFVPKAVQCLQLLQWHWCQILDQLANPLLDNNICVMQREDLLHGQLPVFHTTLPKLMLRIRHLYKRERERSTWNKASFNSLLHLCGSLFNTMLWCYWRINIASMSRINDSFIFMCKRMISTWSIERYNGFKLAVKNLLSKTKRFLWL